MNTSIIVLGSGQDGGSPQTGSISSVSHHRNASSVALISSDRTVLLLDASPDIRAQSQSLLSSSLYPTGRERFVDGVFITHAHMGHYMGLLHFGREALASELTPLYGTERFLTFLGENEPWSTLLRDGSLLPNRIDGVITSITNSVAIDAIPVPHRDEFSDTVALSVSIDSEPWLLYLPDIDDWGLWSGAEDVISRHNVALLDATFSSHGELPHRDMGTIGHPLVPDTIERFKHLTADTKIYLTHINHSNPLGNPNSAITHLATDAGFKIAYDGLTLRVGE